MRNRYRSEIGFYKHRSGIALQSRTSGAVSGVTDGGEAGQALDIFFIERLRNQAQVTSHGNRIAVCRSDACTLLPAMLQGIERKECNACYF